MFSKLALTLLVAGFLSSPAMAAVKCKLVFKKAQNVEAGKGYIGNYNAKVVGSDVVIKWRGQDIRLADNGLIFTMSGQRMGSYRCGDEKLLDIVAGS